MSHTTTISPESATLLRTLAAEQLRSALKSASATLAATPDEKFEFKVSETAKSIKEMVEHTIYGNSLIGGCLGLEIKPVEGSMDRDALVDYLVSTTEMVAATIESLSDDTINGTVEFFGGPMPTSKFIFLNEWHVSRHVSQIDYVQTIYGDLVDHR